MAASERRLPRTKNNPDFLLIIPSSNKSFPFTHLDFIDPATPKGHQFSFSPGQHAEKLRLLKQSPGVGYMHKTRLMFQKSKESGNVMFLL